MNYDAASDDPVIASSHHHHHHHHHTDTQHTAACTFSSSAPMNSEYHCIKPLLWACSNTLYTSYIGSWDLLYTYVCSTIGAGIWVSIVLLNSGLALCFTDDNRPNTSGLSVSKNHQETRTIYFEKLFVSSQGTWVNTPLLRYLMVKVKMNLVSV